MSKIRKWDECRTTRAYSHAVQLWMDGDWSIQFEGETEDEARSFLKQQREAWPKIAADDWRIVSVETTRVELRIE